MIVYRSRPCEALRGRVAVPGDKSISHRAIIFAAIANGTTQIEGLLMSEDVCCTAQALRSCAVKIEGDEKLTVVEGKGLRSLQEPADTIDCGNSGTAIRLLTGLFSGQGFATRLIGDESLSKRPMRRVVEPLERMGASIDLSARGTPPVSVNPVKRLDGIRWQLPVASAQVQAAVLLGGLYCDSPTQVVSPSVVRDHTVKMLCRFGSNLETDGFSVTLAPGAQLSAQRVAVPGDISSAAFLIAAALLIPGSDLTIINVGTNPTRTGLLRVLKAMGASIELDNPRLFGLEEVADIKVRWTPDLKGVDVDPQLIPTMIDEVPVLAVIGAGAHGTTVLSGCEELRVKESDRLDAMTKGLRNLGVKVQETADGMVIEGGQIQGGRVDSFGDHRIAMAFAVAGGVAQSQVEVLDCACVNTSFPGFPSLAARCGMDIAQDDQSDEN